MGQAATTLTDTPCIQNNDPSDMNEPSGDSLEEQYLQLQIEEMEGSRTIPEGEQRDGIKTDYELALELFQADIEANQSILADRRMAESMGRALFEDDAIIATFINQEEAAHTDRSVALAIEQHGCPQERTEEDIGIMAQDPTTSSFLENMRRVAMKENYQVTLQHCTRSPHHGEIPQVERRNCTACTNSMEVFELGNLPCSHDYCRTCLSKLFIDSTRDETLFPPRCCRQNIKVEHVRSFLDAGVVTQFMERKEELETPNRTYCREQRCSKFIGKDAIQGDIGHCTCGVATCCICKNAPHQGADCPEDSSLHTVLEAARAAGWRRCNACSRIIELTYGCNHMTCHCGAEFCYECEAPWHTCRCEQWSEDRLLGRARVIQQRNLNRTGQADGVGRENGDQELQAIARDLRANHLCTHDNWGYITGSHQCEECTQTLPSYIFECRQCHLRACWRCRNNRL